MKVNKKSFKLYHDACKTLNELTDEEAGQLFKAICTYSESLNDITKNPLEPTGLSRIMQLVFLPFKQQLLRDFDKYAEVCRRNKANGERGGRPPKNPSGSTKTHSNPLEPDNDNHNDTHNHNEKDTHTGDWVSERRTLQIHPQPITSEVRSDVF